MQESHWYYTDTQNRRQGPVPRADVVAAYRRGDVSGDGLVWREGMAQWVPLSQRMEELGIGAEDQATAQLAQPYAPPRAELEGRRGGFDPNDIVYAGFVRRFAALFIDGLILLIPTWLLSFLLIGLAGGLKGQQDENAAAAGFAVVLYYVLLFTMKALYFAGMESSANQGTFGKRAMGIKVTDEQGNRLSFAQALGRWFAAALSYLTVYVGFLMAGFTDRKRALHDMVAGTLVVDKWAYTPYPERQNRNTSGCLIALIVCLALIFPIAILAAIAIPAYQDYVIRSQIAEGAALAEGPKTAVAEYYSNRHEMPHGNTDAGVAAPSAVTGNYVESVSIEDGVIRVTYGNQANTAIRGSTLNFAPHPDSNSIHWTCDNEAGTTVNPKYRPMACR